MKSGLDIKKKCALMLRLVVVCCVRFFKHHISLGISSAINLICEAHCDSAQDVRKHITVQCHARRQTGMTRIEHVAKNHATVSIGTYIYRLAILTSCVQKASVIQSHQRTSLS